MAFKRTAALAFLASLFFSILAYYHTIQLTVTSSSSQLDENILPLLRHEASPITQNDNGPMDEADFIIQRAYAESYGRMADCNDDLVESACIQMIVDQFKQQSTEYNRQSIDSDNLNVSAIQPLPWWFQTLLRDIPTNGAYGFWHHFSTSSTVPPMKFCAIGKNGSTEWRKVFKALNAPEFGGLEKSKYNTKKLLDDDSTEMIPQTVFLRDPLERLLSAYLDKCVKDNIRRTQGHCEPNAIFAKDWMNRRAAKADKSTIKSDGANNKPKDDKEEILSPQHDEVSQDVDKEMFAAYVDLFPLKWNVHFVPQAIFCDLYRNIQDYDVYYMGKSFMSELDRISTTYGGLLPDTLNEIFDYKSQLDKIVVGAENNHGTQAPAKVARYYSPRAVRRALEYLSIDYVTLGLEVPGWARDMLRNDNNNNDNSNFNSLHS
eukprot:scaffold56133_cov71-Cyclotella_meneghiniana.AAC.5